MLNKTTSGTVILSGNNAGYTGATPASTINVDNGTLVFSADNNLGNATNGVTLNGSSLPSSATPVWEQ